MTMWYYLLSGENRKVFFKSCLFYSRSVSLQSCTCLIGNYYTTTFLFLYWFATDLSGYFNIAHTVQTSSTAQFICNCIYCATVIIKKEHLELTSIYIDQSVI